MVYLKRWLKEQLVLHRARVLVSRRGLPLVAYAMFRLNRAATAYRRGSTIKETIYTLKNGLIEFLYKNSYCTSVQLHRQNTKCWDCDGTGQSDWYDGDDCRKCEGTGIYRTHLLYVFRFQVGDQFYTWHQPADLVTWDVAVTDPNETEYEAREKQIVPVHGARLHLLLAAVAVYLKQHGVQNLPQTLPLRSALYFDLLHGPHTRILQTLDGWRHKWERFTFDLSRNLLTSKEETLLDRALAKLRLPEWLERRIKSAFEEHDLFYCDERGCFARWTTACRLYDFKNSHELETIVSYYCSEHAKPNGFCWGCGGFWSGAESFDFSKSIYCSNCEGDIGEDDEFESEEDEFDPYAREDVWEEDSPVEEEEFDGWDTPGELFR